MNNKITAGHIVLLAINIVMLIAFGAVFLMRKNYEFMIYVGAIIACLTIIGVSFFKVGYSFATLIGLTIWSFMHMAGGSVFINGVLLYEMILIPASQKYPIFRYDQLVHIFGFASATLVMYDVLRPLLRENLQHYIALSVVVVMAGLGVGAFNEIVEALVAATVPESGVGDYVNTALDLIADLIGAILAMAFIKLRYLKY
ncbi:MAG: DUF2238 domain-containing protein [Sedimentisphaerales bacterium]|nr:DUF2238 domain-containing protein [Sedimentisphaerales bacterium]